MGRGLGGSGARKVWVASGGPSPGPATCDKRRMVVSARHPLGPQAPACPNPLPTSSKEDPPDHSNLPAFL